MEIHKICHVNEVTLDVHCKNTCTQIMKTKVRGTLPETLKKEVSVRHEMS